MAYEVDKELPCQDCGTLTYRRMNKTREPLCVLCAIKHATANTIQLRQHSGPYYEKWRASMSAEFDDKGRTSTTSPNSTDLARLAWHYPLNRYSVHLAGVAGGQWRASVVRFPKRATFGQAS